MKNSIPVLKPLLPTADSIAPYLEEIDATRWYSNGGPMVARFEARMADALGLEAENVVLLANGTLGLVAALLAHDIPRGHLCLLPSWTFTATAAAALAAGLTPCFVDVERDTQCLTPALAKQAMERMTQPVGAILTVAPFGKAVDAEPWDQFSREHRLPCIIDAAASFDAVYQRSMPVGDTPVMISLHATKVLGIGEGGLVLSRDKALTSRLRRIINFGFEDDRLTHCVAINAKPSEYTAAIGMAALDNWAETRAGFEAVHRLYRRRLSAMGIDHTLSDTLVSSTCNILSSQKAAWLAAELKASYIDCRHWWESGCHTHPAYRTFPRINELENTQWLSQSVLGIPMACDLAEADINIVCDTLARVLEKEQAESQEITKHAAEHA